MDKKIINELYHYGVGHKDGGHSGRYPWGSGDNPKQYKKDYKTATKTINKLSKKGALTKNFTNRDAVYSKMQDEVNKKQAVKDYLEFDKKLNNYIEELAKKQGIRKEQVVISQKDPVGAELFKRMNEAKLAGNEVCDKYLNEYAEALMKDISYTDSEGARAAVRDILIKTGFRNMLW
jgi:hypothetical protein